MSYDQYDEFDVYDDNVYLDDVDEYRGGGRSSDFGRFELKDSVRDHAIMRLSLKGRPTEGSFIPMPNREGTDSLPALMVNKNIPLDAPPHRLYKLRGVSAIPLASFIGPKSESNKAGLSFIDDYSPQEKRAAAEQGKKLNPPLFRTLMRRARAAVEANPRWLKFYKPGAKGEDSMDKDNYIRDPRFLFYMPMTVVESPMWDEDECNEDNPADGLLILTKTAYESMLKSITSDAQAVYNPDYVYSGESIEEMNSREYQINRFGFDIADLRGAPRLRFIGKTVSRNNAGRRSRNASKEAGSSKRMGNHFVCKVSSENYFLDGDFESSLAFCRDMFIHPSQYLNFMPFSEITEILFQRSTNVEWSKMLLYLYRATCWEYLVKGREEEFLGWAASQSVETIYSDTMNADGTYGEYPTEEDDLLDPTSDTMSASAPEPEPERRREAPARQPAERSAQRQPAQQREAPRKQAEERQQPQPRRQAPEERQATPPTGRAEPPERPTRQPAQPASGRTAGRGVPRNPEGAESPRPPSTPPEPRRRPPENVDRTGGSPARPPEDETPPWDDVEAYASDEALADPEYTGEQEFPADYHGGPNQLDGVEQGQSFDPAATAGDDLDDLRAFGTK